MTVSGRVRIGAVSVLSQAWGVLKNVAFDFRRADGTWQAQRREVYERGDAAAILPYSPRTGSVILVRQFRLPAYLRGHDDLLIEAAAGMLDEASPEERIRAEAEEETGYRLNDVRKVFEAFASPGAVTEKIHYFVAEYDPAMRVSDGGGLAEEGEDIETLELPIGEALAMVADGRIVDSKAIMLLQHVALHVFRRAVQESPGKIVGSVPAGNTLEGPEGEYGN